MEFCGAVGGGGGGDVGYCAQGVEVGECGEGWEVDGLGDFAGADDAHTEGSRGRHGIIRGREDSLGI